MQMNLWSSMIGLLILVDLLHPAFPVPVRLLQHPRGRLLGVVMMP